MALLQTLLEARSAQVLDVDADGRVLVATDESGTMQLAEYSAGTLRPLTAFREPVTGHYRPGSRQVVVAMDEGGNEQHQLYLLDLAAAEGPVDDVAGLTPVAVDPAVKHQLGGVSHDGRLLGFASTKRNGVDFDAWVHDFTTGGARCVYDGGGYTTVHGFSPDGRWLTMSLPGPRPLDNDVLVVDLTTGDSRRLLPHDDAAIVGVPAWLDATTCLVASNAGRDTQALWRCDVEAGRAELVAERDWDVDVVTSADGSAVLLLVNADGATLGEFLDPTTFEPVGALGLPEEGVAAFTHLYAGPVLAPDGAFVGYSFSSPGRPPAGYVFDRKSGENLLVAGAPLIAEPAELAAAERHRVRSFDGEEIPTFVFRPTGPTVEPVPGVLVVHGGPEGQSMLTFNAVVQALADAGFAVVVPNVRGSTGYGKRWYSLDDTTKRLDSVQDLAALHAWLPSVGIDAKRAALWGGSYGGYMVLAGVAFQPDLWGAGVDIVGISDLVTFLENTSPYRREVREREYGSLEHDREFLEQASPLRKVDEIVAPLFVIHGANDPRVPLSEAHQLVASLEKRGITTELLVYDDEGHGLAKRANRLDAYPRAIAFLERVLG